MNGKFDRHANMHPHTMSLILKAQGLLGYHEIYMDIANYLAGFFDGFDYSSDILKLKSFNALKERDAEAFELIKSLCETVSAYPKVKSFKCFKDVLCSGPGSSIDFEKDCIYLMDYETNYTVNLHSEFTTSFFIKGQRKIGEFGKFLNEHFKEIK